MTPLLAVLRIHVRTALRSGAIWIFVAASSAVAMGAISLDLFGFDGTTERSKAVLLGSFEIGVSLAAIRVRLAGPGSSASTGFQMTLHHAVGPTSLELGSTIGSALGAWLVGLGPIFLLSVFYKLLVVDFGLLGLWFVGGVIEASVATAWAALGARVAGRVAGSVMGVAALVVGRLDIPAPVRAWTAASLDTTPTGLWLGIATGLLTVIGLALSSSAIPLVREEAA